MGAYPDRPLGRKVQPGESLFLAPSPLYPSDRLALPMISGLCRALGLQESYSLRWASFCLNREASFIPHLLPTGVLVWAILSMLICHCVTRGPLIRSTPLCLAPSPEPRVLAQQSTGKDHRGGLWEQAVSLPICEPSMSACRRWALSLPAVVCGSAALGDDDGARSAADTGDCLHPASCDQDHKRSQAYLGLTEIGKSLLNGLHQMNSCKRIFQLPQVPAPRESFR